MFAKLLKYEWKASWRLLGVLSLAVLGMGVLAVVILRIMFSWDYTMVGSGLMPVMAVMLSVALVIMCVALGVYAVAVQILLLYRFYRHKFTDEGYLTFTLPVNCRQLFLSSYVNILMWTLISGAVLSVTVFVAVLFGPVRDGFINTEVLTGIGEAFRELALMLRESEDGILWVMMALQLVAAVVCAPAVSMTCITIGAVVAKKHKILAAFGINYAFSALMGAISTVFTFLASVVAMGSGQGFLLTGYGIQALLQLGAAVGGYFLSAHLMKHKLNLP